MYDTHRWPTGRIWKDRDVAERDASPDGGHGSTDELADLTALGGELLGACLLWWLS